MNRRSALHMLLGSLACTALGVAIGAEERRRGGETVVRIMAQRFVFTPNEIVLPAGQPVVLEFESLDFVHGFNIPDLKIRADLTPGQVTRVRLPPAKPGVYDFLCDNFCGEGHEQMNGRIVVRV